MHIFPVAVTFILATGVSFAQNPASSAPSGTTRESQSTSTQAKESPSGGSDQGAGNIELGKSQKYKGTLVDAACVRTNASSATNAGASSADRTAKASPAETPAGQEGKTKKKGEAARSSNAGDNCAATANTSDFGLRLRDGRALRLDSVGSERAKEELKTKKKWADAASNGKPIRGTVQGFESGDTLVALSVD